MGIKKISVSQIIQFLTCPRTFYFLYILGIHAPKTDSLFVGSALHSALEVFYKGGDPIEEFKKYLESNNYEKPKNFDIKKHLEGGIKLLELYKTKGPYFSPKKGWIERREIVDLIHPVTHEGLPMPFSFKIDLIAEDDSGDFIVDHKSSASVNTTQTEANRIQGIAYVSAYRSIFGKRPTGFIQNFLVKQKIPKIIPIILQYSVDEEVWFWNLARKVLDMIAKQEYLTARPMVKTFYPCPCKDICPIHGGK